MTEGKKQASSKQRGAETVIQTDGMSGGDWTSWPGGGTKLTLSEGDSEQSSKFRFDTGRESGAAAESDGLMGGIGGESRSSDECSERETCP